MPPTFSLNIMPGHGIADLAAQLEQQNVPRDQVNNVLANCEWYADQSVRDAQETGSATTITLKLPHTADQTVGSRIDGRDWLRRLISRHVGDLPTALATRKDELFEPIKDEYSVEVNVKTSNLAELQKKLAAKNVSLDTLQQQGFHVRVRKNVKGDKQTLTFKRYTSSSNKISKYFSGHKNKLERGEKLLEKILKNSDNVASTEELLGHFSKTKTTAIPITFKGAPTYRALQDGLKAAGTSLEELKALGYQARASEKNGEITLVFNHKHSPKPVGDLDKGSMVLKAVFEDATKLKAAGGEILPPDLDKQTAQNYLDALTHPSTLAQRLEWPTTDFLALELIKNPNDLTLLKNAKASKTRQAFDTLSRLSFLLDENSAVAKLVRQSESYIQLYQDIHGGEATAAVADYLEHAVDSGGGFDERGVRRGLTDLLQRELAERVSVASGYGGKIDPVSEEAIQVWKVRNEILRQAAELGIGLSDAQRLLVNGGRLSYSEFADLQTLKPDDPNERSLNDLFSAHDELKAQIQKLQQINTERDNIQTRLDAIPDELKEARRLLQGNEKHLQEFKNPSDEKIRQMQGKNINPMAVAGKIEKEIESQKAQIETLIKTQDQLEKQAQRLKRRATNLSSEPLISLGQRLQLYQRLEAEYSQAGQLVQDIVAQIAGLKRLTSRRALPSSNRSLSSGDIA